MASNKTTPTKRTSQAAGFLHNVSPLKVSKSNKKYFVADLQENSSEYKRLVCFDPRKHNTLMEAEKAKRPLTFDNVQLGMNLQDSTKTDVIVNDRSTVQVQANIGFAFHNKTDTSDGDQTPLKLKQIDTIPNYNKVTVSATVMGVSDSQIQEVRGEVISKRNIAISDETASLRLTVWGDVQVDQHQSYCFKNLSVRTIDGNKIFTTTPTTQIEPITNLPKEHLCSAVTLERQQITTGKIMSVLIKQSSSCMSCNRTIDIPNKTDKFVRCNRCGNKMRTESVSNTLTATFSVKAGLN